MFIISKLIERRRIKTMVRSLIESIKGYADGTGDHTWTTTQRSSFSSSYWLCMKEFHCEEIGISFHFDSDYELFIFNPTKTRIPRNRALPLLKYLIKIMQDDAMYSDLQATIQPSVVWSTQKIYNLELSILQRIVSGYYQAKTELPIPEDMLHFRAKLSKVEGETLILFSRSGGRSPDRMNVYFTNDKAGAMFKLES